MNDEEQALSEKVDLMGPVFILLGCAQLRAWNSVGESPTV